MGNASSHRKGVVTIVSADKEDSVVHPEIDYISSIGKTEPLDQRNATRISSLSEDSNDILDAMKMLNLTNAAKHETWSAHLLISENQSAVLDQIEQVEEFSEIVLNQSFERCETAKDSSVEIRQLGLLSQNVNDCYISLERALVGLESLRQLLPEEKKMQSFEDYLQQR